MDTRVSDILGPDGRIARRLPGYESRTPQLRLGESILAALDTEAALIAEAGTGVGKSIAYLLPLLLSGRKAIVSTDSKALQDQLAHKDLPFLLDTVEAGSYQVLKGISNYLCWEAAEENGHILSQASMWQDVSASDLHDWMLETETGDLAELPIPITPEVREAITTTTHDCSGSSCEHAKRCHYLRAKAAAETAQIVVANHALLAADLTLRLKTADDIAILPDREVLVIDEAHAFEEAATSAFTLELSMSSTAKLLRSRALRSLDLDQGDLQRTINATGDLFGKLKQLGPGTGKLTATPEMRMDVYRISESFQPIISSIRVSARGQAGGKAKMIDRLANRLSEHAADYLRAFSDGAYQDGYVLFVDNAVRRNGSIVPTVKWTPIAAGRVLRRAMWDRWPTIALSATMTTHGTFGYMRERLGVPANTAELAVGSPFKFKTNALVYFPRNGNALDPTRIRDGASDSERDYFDSLAAEIEALIDSTPGGVLVLFTSRKAMDACYDRSFGRIANKREHIWRQGDFPARELVSRMRQTGDAVIFALRTFWTGIDVPGDALSLVILDKLPFPSPDDPVFKARCEKANAFYDDEWAWFNRLALPACVIQLKQGFGRLIRSQTDRGVVAILDGRLGTKAYGSGIIRSMPPAPQTRSIEDVKRFFARSFETQAGLL